MVHPPLRIVVLISGRGSNLQSLVHAQQDGILNVEVAAVISNRPEAAGLTFSSEQHIVTTVVDHTAYNGRTKYDQALMEAIDQYQPDLVVLAGFMRILTAEFVRHYRGQLINIHPSLLPKFKGLHTHQQALDAGESQHGASVHYVTEELDGGPVFLQTSVAVHAGDDADTLAARVLVEEHKLYPAAVQLIAERRITLVDDAVQLDQTPLHAPLQLNS